LPRAELGFALEEAGDEGFLGFGLGGVGVGFEGGEALDGFGMLGIDFEDAAIERDGAPGEAHHFVKLTELEIGGSVPLVELEGQGEVADGVLTVLRDGGEAAREHGVMLGNVGGDFDAFAEPENGAGEVACAECLLGTGEALVDGFFGFGFFLAEGESAGGGDLLVVGGALFVVDDGLVSDGQAAHEVLEQAEPFAMTHVAVGVKFAGHTMEIIFD